VAPDAQLLVGKVLNDAGKGTDDQILEAIDWAVDSGAKIISMSLGSERYPGQEFAAAYEALAKNLIASSPGVLLIAAAGNESERPSYTSAVDNPAACPSFMSVAAIDEARQVGWFSCAAMDEIGLVDISAPGVAVYSSYKGGGYLLDTGTSMATPIVAGVAALHLQQAPNSKAADLWKSLTDSALPLGDAKDFGAGLVQAAVSAMAPAALAARGKRPAGMPAPGQSPADPKGEVAVSM
jgi:subtilisin family serine protease